MITSALKNIINDFLSCSDQEKIEMLLEFSNDLPELSEHFKKNYDIKKIPECQSPIFLAIENKNQYINLHFYAPKESPTTRGFASILSQGLKGMSAKDILNLDENIPEKLGLRKIISPLRLRGMTSMIVHIKKRVKLTIDDTQME